MISKVKVLTPGLGQTWHTVVIHSNKLFFIAIGTKVKLNEYVEGGGSP